MLNEGFKKENRVFSTTLLIASVVVALLILHYVFGFFPGQESYLNVR